MMRRPTLPDRILGPCLVLDQGNAEHLDLAALFLAPPGQRPDPIHVDGAEIAPTALLTYEEATLWPARFRVPATRSASYHWQGQDYALASDVRGDLRVAFVSCNGEEHDDLSREDGERNVMWARLRREHETNPFALMLQGGDQIYADEVTKGHPLSEDWPDSLPRDPSRHDLDDLRGHLRRGFLERYATLLAMPDYAWLVARIPTLSQWDDHDICDGWGSLQRSRTYSPVGQTLFEVAREAALGFQHATAQGDLPLRFFDPEGFHLSWRVDLPGLRLIAPDLRSERTRRAVMSDAGWQAVEEEAARAAPGHTVILSTVPLLGPRLSVLEGVMMALPKMQEYEDDLRDQWQSRAHRDAWRRMLSLVLDMAGPADQAVTIVSGEIHLATQATMRTGDGGTVHQLVASGITHRAPPRAWARALHVLAAFGETPLPGHPIRIGRLPGQRLRYVAERNYLMLERHGSKWQAIWDLERSGQTSALPL